MIESITICRSCEHYIGGDGEPNVWGGCSLVECKGCGDSMMPDRAKWRLRLANADCPEKRFPAGTRGTILTPPPPLFGEWLNRRATACMGCPNHEGGYRCKVEGGPVGNKVRNQMARCPDNPPRWIEVK